MVILSAILASLVAIGTIAAPQRVVTPGPASWVEALKVPPSFHVDLALDPCGDRSGIDPEEEARLFEPFVAPTTEEARIAVPLLLAMLDDPNAVLEGSGPFHLRRNRARAALVRISFRPIGRFVDPVGCSSRPFEVGAAAQFNAERCEDWRRWWRENAAKELRVWRHEAIEEKLASVVRFDENPEAAESALEDIAILGRTCRTYLTTEDRQALAAIVADASAPPMVRSRAVCTRIALDEADAFSIAERFVIEESRLFDACCEVFLGLEKACVRGRPSLIALARHFAVSAGEEPEREGEAQLFLRAVRAVEQQTTRVEPWSRLPHGTVESRLEIVKRMKAWCANPLTPSAW